MGVIYPDSVLVTTLANLSALRKSKIQEQKTSFDTVSPSQILKFVQTSFKFWEKLCRALLPNFMTKGLPQCCHNPNIIGSFLECSYQKENEGNILQTYLKFCYK